MPSIDLDGDWFFAYSFVDVSAPLTCRADFERLTLPIHPCTVPGNFETDLIAGGLYDGDPFYSMNIVDLRRYEKCHVWYFRSFSAPELNGRRGELTFSGIDCLSEISLNGEIIGTSDNALIEHVLTLPLTWRPSMNLWSISGPPWTNPASIRIPPPSGRCLTMSKRPTSGRRRTLTAGTSCPVHCRRDSGARSAWTSESAKTSAFFTWQSDVKGDLSAADIVLSYQLSLPEVPPNVYDLRIDAASGTSSFGWTHPVLFQSGHVRLTVERPLLWWPRGRGEPNLYTVTIRLLKHGQEIAQRTFKHGIRSIKLDRSAFTDKEGTGQFCFVVNHEPVFIHGTNWVPLMSTIPGMSAGMPRVMSLVDDLGCNMIRCWGGNVYERRSVLRPL